MLHPSTRYTSNICQSFWTDLRFQCVFIYRYTSNAVCMVLHYASQIQFDHFHHQAMPVAYIDFCSCKMVQLYEEISGSIVFCMDIGGLHNSCSKPDQFGHKLYPSSRFSIQVRWHCLWIEIFIHIFKEEFTQLFFRLKLVSFPGHSQNCLAAVEKSRFFSTAAR